MEIKPCPFCEYDQVKGHEPCPGVFAVECPCCGAEGPTNTDKDAAVRQWNARTFQEYQDAFHDPPKTD